ncbi:hypothetical protein RHSIM_Rhsim09G0024700 [Rhododendron simsii]|uniref:F-box associated beta-propeller type 3 domain-containing protein n=1 Tax=Rhododendron simsii TaxID=118357 RepID=A0A834LCF8_RHOSS|nr:hypothetical protein RHSIM_Rhsim09G0024700 [Rhododendron simsii]
MKSNTNHKLIVAPQYNWGQSSSQSSYSVDYQAPDPTLAELKMPWKSGGVEICGSFNGVLLLDIGDGICLWNPSIRMYQKISPPRCTRSSITYALGYDSINDDFKVVGFVTRTAARDVLSMPPFISDGPCTVHVFSSKLSSWKSIGDFDYPCCLCGPGSVLNGAPHWIRGALEGPDRTKELCKSSSAVNYLVAMCIDYINPKQKTKRIRMPQDWMGFDVALYVESLVSPPRCNSTRRHC